MTPLSQNIAARIRETGDPITFARFMENALYDPDYGYYMTGGERRRTGIFPSPIGMEDGDFYTAPCLSPFLARCVCGQLQEIDALLGQPSEFTLLEMGPGDGRFIKDMLEELARINSSLLSRLTVILLERSPSLRHLQEQTLASFPFYQENITWASDLGALRDDSIEGVVVSNELVDAFPVHRVRMGKDGLQEIYVNYVNGQFCEQLKEPSSEEVWNAVQALDVTLPAGFTTEVNLEALAWEKHVARVLRRGVVLTIDYGHTTQDYCSPLRNNGTLMCYYRHTVTTNPYERVGEQDITAHVNFSSLAQVGEQAGLSLTGFTNLMHFLMSLDIDEMVAGHDQESNEVQAAAQLLHPGGMGTTFKVLIQHKGFVAPKLQALRYQPFFEHVLMPKG